MRSRGSGQTATCKRAKALAVLDADTYPNFRPTNRARRFVYSPHSNGVALSGYVREPRLSKQIKRLFCHKKNMRSRGSGQTATCKRAKAPAVLDVSTCHNFRPTNRARRFVYRSHSNGASLTWFSAGVSLNEASQKTTATKNIRGVRVLTKHDLQAQRAPEQA